MAARAALGRRFDHAAASALPRLWLRRRAARGDARARASDSRAESARHLRRHQDDRARKALGVLRRARSPQRSACTPEGGRAEGRLSSIEATFSGAAALLAETKKRFEAITG